MEGIILMGRTALTYIEGSVENTVNLDAVTSATNGASLDLTLYNTKNIYIYVSGNTGAVTVTIQGSSDGTNWVSLKSLTYTVENKNDVAFTAAPHAYMRTITTSHTNATVTTKFTART